MPTSGEPRRWGSSDDKQNLYSAIPGLVKRSIKGCVPRICHLRVTMVEALSQLTRSKSDIKIVVVMNDGRSRLRDGVRSARLKRAALSSAWFPVQSSSTAIAVNIDFFMQYFHNLRRDTDTFRVLVQKKSKRSLVNKVIAECTLVLADVLQAPLDEASQLVLYSTGRLKHSQQAGAVNIPLIRLDAQLESLALDSSDLTRWWPSDKADDGDTPNLDGILSGEEIEEEDEEENEWPEKGDDDDEWVETNQILSDVELVDDVTESSASVYAAGSPGVQQGEFTMAAGGVRRSSNFRSVVLKGTRKIASMTLHPMRAVKNGYARIRSRNSNKGASRVSGQLSPGADALDELEQFAALADEDGDDHLQWVGAWDDDEEDRDDEEGSTSPPAANAPGNTWDGIAALVTRILERSAEHGQGPVITLLNTQSRRGALLERWLKLTTDEEQPGWAEDAEVAGMLRSSVVMAPGVKDIRAALRAIVLHRHALDRRHQAASTAAARSGSTSAIRVAVLGGDVYTHHVVREWVRLRQHTHLGSSLAQPGSPAGYPGSEGVKFFLVPLGVKGRESPLSMQLAARDAQYGHLFLSDHWIELWEALGDPAASDAIGQQIEDYLNTFLGGAGEVFRLGIAEVLVTCSDLEEAGGDSMMATSSTGTSEIVRHHTLPFISSISFRPNESTIQVNSAGAASGGSPSAGGDVPGVDSIDASATGHSQYNDSALSPAVEKKMGAGAGEGPGARQHQQHQLPPTAATHPLSMSPPIPSHNLSPPYPIMLPPNRDLPKTNSSSSLNVALPLDLKLDFWVNVGGGEFAKTSSRGPYLDIQVRRLHDEAMAAPMSMQAVSVSRGYTEKNKRIRAHVSVTDRDKERAGSGGSSKRIKADINRLICTTANPNAHFAVTIDGVRLSPARFVSVSPLLSSTLTKTFPVATFVPSGASH